MKSLENKKIAVLAADGYEQSELKTPVEALKKNGATVEIISLIPGVIRGMSHHEWASSVKVDKIITEVKAKNYDGLFLPGGVLNPDTLRTNEDVLIFVKDFFDAKKPVAAICHGPQTLINANIVKGRTLTSYPSIAIDLENAGAKWVDAEVVTDGNLTTSRSPSDLQDFNKRIIEEFSKKSENQK